MSLFAHHAHGIIELELFGHDMTPDGMVDHIVAGVIVLALGFLLVYGAYASTRDLWRWVRRPVPAR